MTARLEAAPPRGLSRTHGCMRTTAAPRLQDADIRPVPIVAARSPHRSDARRLLSAPPNAFAPSPLARFHRMSGMIEPHPPHEGVS